MGYMKNNVKILKNIHSDEYEVEDKLNAIQDVTIGVISPKSITRSDLIEALRYLIEEYI